MYDASPGVRPSESKYRQVSEVFKVSPSSYSHGIQNVRGALKQTTQHSYAYFTTSLLWSMPYGPAFDDVLLKELLCRKH